MIRLIGLDLDGTLLGGTQPHYGIRDEALEALHEAHRRGIMIGIVTGRDFDFIAQMLAEHRIGPAYTCFPALIIAEERRVYTLEGGAYLPDADWNERIVEEERRHLPAVARLVERLMAKELKEIDPGLVRVDAAIEERRGFIELVFTDRAAAEAGTALLAAGCRASVPDVVPVRNGRGVSLRLYRASKGAVLLYFADRAGIQPEHILAIGDSENDRSMLDGRYGFKSATVSNADESIRRLVTARGGYVAQGAYGAGVAEAIGAVLRSLESRAGA